MFVKTDHIFNMLNVGFLMCIAFLPYPTALLGDFISYQEHRKTVISFYAIGIWLPSMFWFMVWIYGKRTLINKRLKPSFVKSLTRLYVLSNLLYCIAFIISFFNPVLSLIVIVCLTLLYLLPPKKMEFINEEAGND
jgi:uncharacterized membrane protein